MNGRFRGLRIALIVLAIIAVVQWFRPTQTTEITISEQTIQELGCELSDLGGNTVYTYSEPDVAEEYGYELNFEHGFFTVQVRPLKAGNTQLTIACQAEDGASVELGHYDISVNKLHHISWEKVEH